MSDEKSDTLSNLAHEERRFEPPADLADQANATAALYDEAKADRLGFWEKQADRISWGQKWDRVLDWDHPPFAKRFVGRTPHAASNRLPRPRAAATRPQTAPPSG